MYTPPKDTGLNFSAALASKRTAIVEDTAQQGPVSAWSPTLVKKFNACRHRIFIGKVKKVKEPSSEPAQRGIEIHDKAEHFVDGRIPELPPELAKFTGSFKKLREAYNENRVSLEGDWGFDIDWKPCGFFDKEVWLRIKLDACEFSDLPENSEHAVVIDYKTGKKFGNELDHGFQGLCYAIGTFMRYPKLQRIDTEFWYLDSGDTLKKSYHRDEVAIFLPRITKKGVAITSCTDFYPNPSPQNCRFCPYKEMGECEWACEDEAPSKKFEAVKQRGRL